MRYLITGGAGFIGANFSEYILEKYRDAYVVCFDALTYAGSTDNIQKCLSDSRFVFEKGDICDRNTVNGLFEKYRFDKVVNFAAESHVDNSINSPYPFFNTNVIGTSVLLDAVNKYGVKGFHQISTDEVYGDLPIDRLDLSFSEDSTVKPSSPYSSSKASADLICLSYHRTYGTPVTVSRCSNNYGKYQHTEKLIPKIVELAMKNEKIPVYGDGLNVRDWIFVKDHCNAVDMIISAENYGRVYNVGANCEKSNIEIVKTVLGYLNKPENLIEYVADRKGHDRRYAVCSDRIKTELGWKPEADFDISLEDTVRWYVNKFKC